jgi:hypothetical protein
MAATAATAAQAAPVGQAAPVVASRLGDLGVGVMVETVAQGATAAIPVTLALAVQAPPVSGDPPATDGSMVQAAWVVAQEMSERRPVPVEWVAPQVQAFTPVLPERTAPTDSLPPGKPAAVLAVPVPVLMPIIGTARVEAAAEPP